MNDDDSDAVLARDDGPEFAVWVHFSSGVDQARWEMDRLPAGARAFLKHFGDMLFSQRTTLAADPEDDFAKWSQELLSYPWPKFAADLAFADEAVRRGEEAGERYLELQPILTRYRLPDVN